MAVARFLLAALLVLAPVQGAWSDRGGERGGHRDRDWGGERGGQRVRDRDNDRGGRGGRDRDQDRGGQRGRDRDSDRGGQNGRGRDREKDRGAERGRGDRGGGLGGSSASRAADAARRQAGGRVLGVTPGDGGHRVKILTPQGEVRSLFVPDR